MSSQKTLALEEIRMRDPFLVESAPGRFVLFGTTDQNVWGGEATGFDCYTSTDLRRWDGPIAAFRPVENFWSHSQFWAPEVYFRDGRWYMIATFLAHSTGVRGIAVLVADRPIGPYVEWSDGPVTPVDEPCLDGTLFVDDSGTAWLVHSRGPEGGAGVGEMRVLRLSDDLREAAGPPTTLFRASEAEWVRPLDLPDAAREALGLARNPLLTDGPFVRRTSDGSLTMLWSSHSDAGYAMGEAHSVSGDIQGPWTQLPEPVWAHDGGHGMALTTSSGEDLLVFHHPNDTSLERPCIKQLTRSGEGPDLSI